MRALGTAIAAGLIAVAGCSSKEEKTSATGGSGGGASGAGATTAGGGTQGGSQGGANVGGGGTSSGGDTASGGTGDAGSTSVGGSAGTNATGGSASGEGGSATGGDATGGTGGSGGAGNGGSAIGGSGGASTGTLDVYLVDTEGGQATVMRLPGGQVFIVDTGNPGARDGDRIQAVLRDELSATSVDYLLTTHYDTDHVGGATYLNERTPVRNFLDHGDEGAPASYLTMANAGARRVIEAGDTLDAGGVHFDFVCSNGELITTPFPGSAANSFCSGVAMKNESDENENSVGFILRFGTFDFIDLGDLLWDWELRLACPTNLLGKVDLYMTTHHGLTRSGASPLVRGIEPLAAVMNNGPRKGGGGSTWTTLAQAPGAMHVWQLHQALASPAAENPAADQIANLTEGGTDMAFFLKVTVASNGSFTILNPRTNTSRMYQAR